MTGKSFTLYIVVVLEALQCIIYTVLFYLNFQISFSVKQVKKTCLFNTRTHSAVYLLLITLTEDIQRVCQRGGYSARRPQQNHHLAQRWASTKGSGQGSFGRLQLPTPFSNAFFSLSPLPPLFLESPTASTPHPSPSSVPSIFLPIYLQVFWAHCLNGLFHSVILFWFPLQAFQHGK